MHVGVATADAKWRHARRGLGFWKVQLSSDKQQIRASISEPWSRQVTRLSNCTKPDHHVNASAWHQGGSTADADS